MANYISINEVYNLANDIYQEIANKQYGAAAYYASTLRQKIAMTSDYMESQTAAIVRQLEQALREGGLASEEIGRMITGAISGIQVILGSELNKLDTSLNDLNTTIEAKLEFTATQISNAIEKIDDGLKEVFTPMIEALKTNTTSMMEMFRDMISLYAEQMTVQGEAIQNLVGSLNTDLMLLFTTIVSDVELSLNIATESVNATLKEVSEMNNDMLYSLSANIQNVIKSNTENLSSYIETSDDRIEKLLTMLNTSLNNLTSITLEDIKDGFNLGKAGNLLKS